jgi:hypothetical protein
VLKKNLLGQAVQTALDVPQALQLATEHAVHFPSGFGPDPAGQPPAWHLSGSRLHLLQVVSVQAMQLALPTAGPNLPVHSSQVVRLVHLPQLARHLVHFGGVAVSKAKKSEHMEQLVPLVQVSQPSTQAVQTPSVLGQNFGAQAVQMALETPQAVQLAAHLTHFPVASGPDPAGQPPAWHLSGSRLHLLQVVSVQAMQLALPTAGPKLPVHSSQVVRLVHLPQLARHLTQRFFSVFGTQVAAHLPQVPRVGAKTLAQSSQLRTVHGSHLLLEVLNLNPTGAQLVHWEERTVEQSAQPAIEHFSQPKFGLIGRTSDGLVLVFPKVGKHSLQPASASIAKKEVLQSFT